MAKRKRDADESHEEIVVDKKSKTDHKQPKSKHSTSSSTAAPNDKPSAAIAQPNAAAAHTTTAVVDSGITGSHTNLLEAPPGLSKGARKRWRKRQKLAAAQASQPQLKQEQTTSKDVPPPPALSRESKQLKTPMPDQSLLRSFGTTQLMPKRQKVWHEQAPNQTTGLENPSMTDLPEMQQATVRVKTPSSDNEDTDLIRPELNESQSDSDGEGSSSSHSPATSADTGPKKSATQIHGHLVKKPELPRKIEAPDSVRLLAPQATTASVRRTSFGNRATSVPSFSNSSDPVESFRRFSAWLHKGDSDSEDSESEDEESKNEISGETVPTDGADELMLRVAAAPQVANGSGDNGSGTAQSSNGVRQMSSDEVDADQLPRFSDSTAPLTPGNGSTWPANVGIKRHITFLGQEPGGTPYGSGVGLDSEPNRSLSLAGANMPSDPFEIHDDSQELLRTVDEISNTVFGSTRTLPASKTRRSLDPGNEARENGVLTSASSDRRMTRSMAAPNETPKHGAGGNDGLRLLSTDPTTVSSHNTALDEQQDESVQNEGEASPDSMSSNIDVIKLVPSREASRARKSTSSLSELSRSPSPPPEAALLASILQELNEPKKQSQSPDVNREADADDIVVLPRKKRKMTGTTSKHFTPKKETRQRMSTARNVETTNELASDVQIDSEVENVANADVQSVKSPEHKELENPKRYTRASSKVEELQRDEAMNMKPGEYGTSQHTTSSEQPRAEEELPPAQSTRSSTKKRKSTGKRSSYFTPSKPALDPEIIDRVDFYNTTSSAKKARVPAGTSIAPVPPITAERFGIIQEKLWREPFWLLIAVTFLNKTTGRAAVPVFWALKKKYATPEALAKASQDELCEIIHHLGLQNQRARRLISMAQAWVEQVPENGRRSRTLHYPTKNDGRGFKPSEIVEEDADDCAGALEIAHIPGCGPYAWDSWRIFCRDVLRRVAEDYNGAGRGDEFVPEWKKVLPGDKELRACLRWMWLREGWIWDHETGEKKRATEAEMQKALQGEMEIDDPQERKFAAQAAGIEVSPVKVGADEVDAGISEEIKGDVEAPLTTEEAQPRTPEPPQTADDDGEADNIVVTPVFLPATRKRRHRPSLRGTRTDF